MECKIVKLHKLNIAIAQVKKLGAVAQLEGLGLLYTSQFQKYLFKLSTLYLYFILYSL